LISFDRLPTVAVKFDVCVREYFSGTIQVTFPATSILAPLRDLGTSSMKV